MGTGRRIVWTKHAVAALDEVLEYVAQDSPDGARKILTKTLQAASRLSTLSERGRIVPEVDSSDIRETLVYRYRLLYQVTSDEVRVLAFLHGARDFEKWRKKKPADPAG